MTLRLAGFPRGPECRIVLLPGGQVTAGRSVSRCPARVNASAQGQVRSVRSHRRRAWRLNLAQAVEAEAHGVRLGVGQFVLVVEGQQPQASRSAARLQASIHRR